MTVEDLQQILATLHPKATVLGYNDEFGAGVAIRLGVVAAKRTTTGAFGGFEPKRDRHANYITATKKDRNVIIL